VPEDDLVDHRRIELGALQQRLGNGGAELVRGHIFQDAAERALRGAYAVNDYDFFHVSLHGERLLVACMVRLVH